LSFIFLARNINPNEINGLTFKSDRLLEAAIREQAKERAERFAAWREKRENEVEHHDLIDRLQMRSQWMTQRASDLDKLIAAAKPLYESLDDGQKRRFAELMRPPGRGDRQHWRREG